MKMAVTMTMTVMIATQIVGDKCTGNEVAIGDGKAPTGSETKYRILKRECMKKYSQKYKTKIKSNHEEEIFEKILTYIQIQNTECSGNRA